MTDFFQVIKLSPQEATAAMAEAEIVRILAGTYKPEGIVHWLTHRNWDLDGAIPRDLLAQGEHDRVIRYAQQIVQGDPV